MKPINSMRTFVTAILLPAIVHSVLSRRQDPVIHPHDHPPQYPNHSVAISTGSTAISQLLQYRDQLSNRLSVVNTWNDSDFNIYVTGKDLEGRLVILTPSGGWDYPSVNGSLSVPIEIPVSNITIPIRSNGQAMEVELPDHVSAGRIWFAWGNLTFSAVKSGTSSVSLVQPSLEDMMAQVAVLWTFVEFTYDQVKGLWVNLSFVDFVSLGLGIVLTSSPGSNSTRSSQTLAGLQPNAVSAICQGLKNQSMVDGCPWDDLCLRDSNRSPFLVLSPIAYIEFNPTAFLDYWTCYIEEVWTRYTAQSLTINTVTANLENILCSVKNDLLSCTSTDELSGVEQFLSEECYKK